MEVRVKRADPNELMHYGVKGMKWGVRKDQKSGGGRKVRTSLERGTTMPKGRYDKEQYRVADLDYAVKKSKKEAATRKFEGKNSISDHVYKKSKTMRELDERLKDAYKERNDVYEKYKKGLVDEDTMYNAGTKFYKIADKTLDDMLGVFKNTPIENIRSDDTLSAKKVCMNLIAAADMDNIGTNGYHDMAWLYWH